MCLHTLCKGFSYYLSQARCGHIWHNGSGNWFCHRRCPVSRKSSWWIQSPQEGGVRARWQCFWVFRNGAWNCMQVGYNWNHLPQLPAPYSRHKRNRQTDRFDEQCTDLKQTDLICLTIERSKLTRINQWLMTNLTQALQPIPSWLNWPTTFNGSDL